MRRSWWKTGAPIKHQQPVVWPTGRQLLRQLLVLAAVVVVWGGLLMLFAKVAGTPSLASLAAVNEPTRTPAPPTVTPAAAPTNTPPAMTPTTASSPTIPTATSAQSAAPATPSSPTAPAATSTQAATPTSAATPTVQVTQTKAPTVAAVTTPLTGTTSRASFSGAVLPIFTRVCVKCHGGEKTQEGLVLKSYADVMAGSNNGPVITPGDPANSLLVDMITQGKMPKNGPKLLPKQIQAIVDWVTAGAPDN